MGRARWRPHGKNHESRKLLMIDLDKIVALLDDPASERRVAAAIVLGALRPKSAAVVE